MDFKKPDSYKNVNTSSSKESSKESTNSQPNKPPSNIKPAVGSYRL